VEENVARRLPDLRPYVIGGYFRLWSHLGAKVGVVKKTIGLLESGVLFSFGGKHITT
jgi:hypothetical protein